MGKFLDLDILRDFQQKIVGFWEDEKKEIQFYFDVIAPYVVSFGNSFSKLRDQTEFQAGVYSLTFSPILDNYCIQIGTDIESKIEIKYISDTVLIVNLRSGEATLFKQNSDPELLAKLPKGLKKNK